MKINLNVFREFVRSGSIGGIILLLCVFISLCIANSPLGSGFEQLVLREIGFSSSYVHLRYTAVQWVNDGLMAIFFLLVGLEIKRELIEGELSTVKRSALPVFAAFGGAAIPALIYSFFNDNTVHAAGWGIPMATDIAFAIGIISILGKKAPSSLKIFLAALAIVDDLIAIFVIALFYSSDIHFIYLICALGVFLLMLALNLFKVKHLSFYLLPGILLWYFIHHSGIHATIAGVLTAITIPTTSDATESPLEKLEHFLTKPVNFIIMPIFALVNTNIRFESGMIDGLYSNLGLGIIFGLILGKPVGITLMSWIVVKLGFAELPRKAKWVHILGIGLLGGIGFTMSIFIALLSFNNEAIQTEAKFAVLIASTISGLLGYMLFTATSRKLSNTE